MSSCDADLAWFLVKICIGIIILEILAIGEAHHKINQLEDKMKKTAEFMGKIKAVVKQYPDKKGRK